MKQIAVALMKAKSAFPSIQKNKINPHFKNKYANLESILDAITKPLYDNGLVLIQPTIIRDDVTVLVTQLIHESGEYLSSELILPVIADPQKLGIALTYYRRFNICSLLAITADDDDDGNTATANVTAKTKATEVKKAPEVKVIPVDELADVRKHYLVLIRKMALDPKTWSAENVNPAPSSEWKESDWLKGIDKLEKLVNATTTAN